MGLDCLPEPSLPTYKKAQSPRRGPGVPVLLPCALSSPCFLSLSHSPSLPPSNSTKASSPRSGPSQPQEPLGALESQLFQSLFPLLGLSRDGWGTFHPSWLHSVGTSSGEASCSLLHPSRGYPETLGPGRSKVSSEQPDLGSWQSLPLTKCQFSHP